MPAKQGNLLHLLPSNQQASDLLRMQRGDMRLACKDLGHLTLLRTDTMLGERERSLTALSDLRCTPRWTVEGSDPGRVQYVMTDFSQTPRLTTDYAL